MGCSDLEGGTSPLVASRTVRVLVVDVSALASASTPPARGTGSSRLAEGRPRFYLHVFGSERPHPDNFATDSSGSARPLVLGTGTRTRPAIRRAVRCWLRACCSRSSPWCLGTPRSRSRRTYTGTSSRVRGGRRPSGWRQRSPGSRPIRQQSVREAPPAMIADANGPPRLSAA